MPLTRFAQSQIRNKHLMRPLTTINYQKLNTQNLQRTPLQLIYSQRFTRDEISKIVYTNYGHNSFNYRALCSFPILALLFIATAFNKAHADAVKPLPEPRHDIDENKLTNYIYDGWNSLKVAEGKNIVLVMGNTGSGKSTLINYLLGNKLEKKKDEEGKFRWYRVEGDTSPGPKIGHEDDSETIHPAVYQNLKDRIFYCDLSGFEDTRDKTTQTWAHVSRDLVVKTAEQVSSIIVVLSEEDLANKNAFFKKLCKTLSLILSLDSNFDSVTINMVFTKNGEKTEEEVKKSLLKLSEKLQKNLDTKKESILSKLTTVSRRTLENLNEANEQERVKLKDEIEKDSKLEELRSEFEQLDLVRQIKVLDILLHQSKIVIAKDYNSIETRNAIVNNLRSEDLFGSNRLRFTRPKDPYRFYFDPHLAHLAGKFQTLFENQKRIFSDLIALERDLEIINNELKKHPTSEDSEQQAPAMGMMKELIDSKTQEMNRYTSEISVLEQELKRLDNDDPYLYWSEHEDEKRSWYGFLNYTKRVFQYPGHIPFLDAKTNTGKASRSSFINEKKDKDKPVYEVTYQTGFYEDADGYVELYIRTKDYPEHKKRIAEISNIVLPQKKSAQKTVYDELEELKKLNNIENLRKKYVEYTNKQLELKKEFSLLNESFTKDTLSKMETVGRIMKTMDNEDSILFLKSLSDFCYILGQYFYKASEIEKAISAFERAIKHNSSHADANFQLARCYQRKSDSQQYQKHMRLSACSGSQEAKRELEEQKIPIFDLGYDILNPYIYSIMAELAYCNPMEFQKENGKIPAYLFKKLQDKNWEVLTTPYENAGCNKKTGYQAIAFIHRGSKQIVIAHRGTQNAESVLADIAMLRMTVPTQYQEGAKVFTKQLLEHYKDYAVSHTGHSLGGSLAAFSAYETGSAATIFDPFGVKHILFNNMGESFDTSQLPITTYLSRVNIVNGTAPHVGLVLEIQSSGKPGALTIPDLGVPLMRYCFEQYSDFGVLGTITEEMYEDLFKKHSMSIIRSSFETENKLPAAMGLVEAWPDDLARVFAHHNFTFGVLGNQTHSPNASTLTDGADVFRLKFMYNYQVNGIGKEMNRLDVRFFPTEFVDILRKRRNNSSVVNNYDIDHELLESCTLIDDTETTKQYVSILSANKVDIFQLKSYVDRKIGAYNLRHPIEGRRNRELRKSEENPHSVQLPKKEEKATSNLFFSASCGAVGLAVGAAATYWFGRR